MLSSIAYSPLFPPMVKSTCEPVPKSLFWTSSCVPGLSAHYGWPVKKAIVQLANQVEGKFEMHFW